MNRLISKLNPTDATDECHPDIFKSDSLKVPKLLFRFSLRAANSLATSIRQSLSVLCLWVLSIVRLLNLVCVIVERSHVFSLLKYFQLNIQCSNINSQKSGESPPSPTPCAVPAMYRCEGYGFQAVYSGLGYINLRVWV